MRGAQQNFIYFDGQGSAGIRITNNISMFNRYSPNTPAIWTEWTAAASGYTQPAWINPNGTSTSTNADGWASWRQAVMSNGATPPGFPAHYDVDSAFANNAFILGTSNGDTEGSTGLVTKTQCESYLGSTLLGMGNKCWDPGVAYNSRTKREQAVGFAKYSPNKTDWEGSMLFDFRLKYNSAFKSGAPSSGGAYCDDPNQAGVDSNLCMRATDGTDMGPDMERLNSELGVVSGARYLNVGTNSVSISYRAPDSAACFIDYWKGLDIPTRVSDGGGARDRLVPITGLTSGAAYTAIVQCEVDRPVLTFNTN
jgi:hypothetical protein